MFTTVITPSLLFSLATLLVMACFHVAGLRLESLLEYSRTMVLQGQYWRLLTSNLVHYGFAHFAMNSAALLLISFTLLRELRLTLYLALVIFAALSVTLGILVFNPELDSYRGFSGILHGMLVAGLLLNHRRNPWVSALGLVLIIAKLVHEHTPNFQANQLQSLLPVMVAVDSHLYGAISGLAFAAMIFLTRHLANARQTPI